MEYFGFVAATALLWAWWFPHAAGEWMARFRDPYRQVPRHQKKKKS